MTALFAILTVVLIAVIVVQIGKVTELAAKIRGEEEMQQASDKRQSIYLLIFMVVFLIIVSVTGVMYSNFYLGFGPHAAASENGGAVDRMFQITLFFTGVVFFITQILLFYFAYRYKAEKGRKALYMPHDNRLEIVWTVVPAVVMAFLVISGLDAWNEIMADVDPDEEFIEVEATGYQFAWHLRYPGTDAKLGARDYTLINGSNPLGQDWKDEKNLDDLHPSELVLPVGKKVRVRITARDVLHNFYLPHFRVKMDAVPGMPTYFVFTPSITTDEYRLKLREYPEYQKPVDPADPESPMLWENFNFELACAELCGTGHWSMRRVVRIVTEEEYQDWLSQQQPYYFSTIRGTDDDPYRDIWFEEEIQERRSAFNEKFEGLLTNPDENIFVFDHVNFETASATLTPVSKYEIDFLVDALNKYPSMRIDLAGHTDSVGDDEYNMELSRNRAKAVYDYLIGKGITADRLKYEGFGETRPVDTNDTDAGRAKNRRTEFLIINPGI